MVRTLSLKVLLAFVIEVDDLKVRLCVHINKNATLYDLDPLIICVISW